MGGREWCSCGVSRLRWLLVRLLTDGRGGGVWVALTFGVACSLFSKSARLLSPVLVEAAASIIHAVSSTESKGRCSRFERVFTI